MSQSLPANTKAYWHAHLRLLAALLGIWFACSFGLGILWVDWLDQFRLFGFKLGFWFSQQGSIFCFVLLIFYYVHAAARLDRRYGVDEDAAADPARGTEPES